MIVEIVAHSCEFETSYCCSLERGFAGDAKYLKWYDMAKSNNAHGGAKSRSTGAVADDHVTDAKPQEPELKGTLFA